MRNPHPYEHEVWPHEGYEDLPPHELQCRGMPWDKNGKLRAGMELELAGVRDYFNEKSAEIEADWKRFAEQLKEYHQKYGLKGKP